MRVLIVDDHPATRQGLRAALGTAPDVDRIAEASSGEEAVRAVEEVRPDVVLMDVRMPGMGGIEATARICREHPRTKVILFTIDESRASVMEAFRAGASGYLLKDVTADEIVKAARLTMEGKTVIHPVLTRALIDELGQEARPTESPLSRREIEVLQKVASGFSTKEAARDLGISTHTVKTHLERAFDKLGVSHRAEAVAVALRQGLVQ